MGIWRPGIMLAVLFAALSCAAPSRAKNPPEMIADIVHADVPLYGFDWDYLWPRSIGSNDDIGCESRVGFGDWRFTPAVADDEARWERFANYGVFHCAAVFRTAQERSALGNAAWRYGFFVKLGTGRKDGRTWELWALQAGIVPGSDYTLLAREPDNARIVAFNLLQQRCPASWYRQARNLDIWTTRYCAVGSRADLLALARRMLALPALGRLQWIGEGDSTE